MEVAPCVQRAGSYAASLVASLNLQRQQALFCDCVVRQRQNPGQLYPAHRCVLAASSPVLESILSSAGALVELQAPCLSDSVLELVLDYIYTGALPNTLSQQQYYNLLAAARYLQMDELQETLRTEVNPADNTNASTGAENQPYKDINNTYSKTVNAFSKFLLLSDTCSVREDQYCDQIGSSSKNGANCCSRKDVRPLSNLSTSCKVPESPGSSVNTGNCRQVTYLTPQALIQNIPRTAEVNRVSKVDTEVQKDQFHSAGAAKPESWQINTEEELVRTAKNRRSLYILCTAEVQEEEMNRPEKTQRLCLTVKSKAEEKQPNSREEEKIHHVSPSQCSSSSPHPSCGAVPVIRHSSTAAMAEVSTTPHYHPVSQASVSPNRAPDSRSGSTDSEGITTKHKNHYGAQNQDYRNNKDHIGTQSWDYKDCSDQCAIQDFCYKSKADQCDILKQDYDSSSTDHDEHMGNGLSHTTGDDDQNKNHAEDLIGASVQENKDCSSLTRGLKYKTDLSFDDFPSKHQRLDRSDCHNVSMTTAAEEQPIHSQDPRALVSLPAQESDTGSDSHCEDLCPKGEAKEEHSYSSRYPAILDTQTSHCNLSGPKNDWYPNLHKAERSTKDAASIQHEHNDRGAAVDNVTGCTLLQHENISGTEISEPRLAFAMPLDNNMSDLAYNGVEQSYRGHLHYHCLPQVDTHRDSDHKHSHTSHTGHSEQSSDEEEVGSFASPSLSPLRQHFAPTDQVLLLDISAKPAELLVSYRHGSDEQEKWLAIDRKDAFGNGFGDNDREQLHEATSVAGVDKRKSRARAKFGAESFDEAETKRWVGKTVEERKSVVIEQSRPGAEIIHNAGGVEGENQTTTLTVCSPPSVPDSVQAPVSSTLSVCIPSTLSAGMPTNISAHLSTPVHHPFQCSLCDRSFSQRGSLNRHVRSHLGVRPFPCPRCPMTFSRQYRVSEHMRVHQRCVLGSDFQKPPASSI